MRLSGDQTVAAAVHRVALALAEVKVVERRREGAVVGRAVVNRDAVERAKRAYREATRAVAEVRLKSGAASGSGRDSRAVTEASERLAHLERELREFERLR